MISIKQATSFILNHSLQWSGDTEKDYGGFLQVDKRCKVSVSADGKHILEEIDSEPVDLKREHFLGHRSLLYAFCAEIMQHLFLKLPTHCGHHM